MEIRNRVSELYTKADKRYRTICLIVIASTVLCVMVCLCLGRYWISPSDILKIISNSLFSTEYSVDGSAENILRFIRIPRICTAYLVGIALSISGAVYQSIFNNPLVSPDILGVDSGACVGAGIAILLNLSAPMMTLLAFFMGLCAIILAFGLQSVFKSRSSLTLVLAGIIVSAFMNAIVGLIKYLADSQEKLSSFLFWTLGDLSGVKMADALYLFPIVFVCVAILLGMSWRMNAISLGESEAKSIGIHFRRERLIVILCATLLTSASISVSGTVGWIGLIVPHIARIVCGDNNRRLLPLSVLVGGPFMVVADTLARTLSPSEIPLGIITGFFGAIVYTIVLAKKGVRTE